MAETREDSEREFWDAEVPTLDEAFAEYAAGPDRNTAAVLDALAPLHGQRILDVACGGGVTATWLAARGARVTGVDVSPASVGIARQLAARLDLDVAFEVGPLDSLDGPFDRIAGRYALHHVDVATVAPRLAALLVPGGRAAFLETMATNPLLRLARRRLVGRLGIPAYGTPDEHPLDAVDLAVLRQSFGALDVVVPQYTFLRIFDRQVLRHRSRLASRALGAADDLLGAVPALRSGSYHQVLILTRRWQVAAGRERGPVTRGVWSTGTQPTATTYRLSTNGLVTTLGCVSVDRNRGRRAQR